MFYLLFSHSKTAVNRQHSYSHFWGLRRKKYWRGFWTYCPIVFCIAVQHVGRIYCSKRTGGLFCAIIITKIDWFCCSNGKCKIWAMIGLISNLILESTCEEKLGLHLNILSSIRWQKIQCFINTKYIEPGFSQEETSFLQVRLVPSADSDCHPIEGGWHLYSPFSQGLRKILNVVSSPDGLCDKSLPQLRWNSWGESMTI